MAHRPLKGARYWRHDTAVPDLATVITQYLDRWDFEETIAFYNAFQAMNPSESDMALLGLNDLYYLIVYLCKRRDALHPWLFDRAREVEREPDGCLDLWARGHYKDLKLSTPVLTTEGWRAHGDLKPGDRVFCPDGSTSAVVATRHFTDSKCYRITFCNGVSLVAGAGHLWPVQVSSRKRVPGTFKGGESHGKRLTRAQVTLTTDELYQRLAKETYRPAIRITAPLRGRRRKLPIDPYLLGAWLGDGYSSEGAICGIDREIFEEISRRGSVLHYRKIDPTRHADYRVARIEGLTPKIKALGLIRNKHVPEAYLTASEQDRRALLWGLIDTDGSVGKANAAVTFANTNRRLIDDVVTLAASLGYKPRVSPARTSNSWHVTFVASARDPHPPCWLPRKRAMLKDSLRHLQSQSWYVTSIEPIESEPTNCIQIEAEHGLYLVGRELIPTHNSTFITFGKTIQDVLDDPELTVGIFSFSQATSGQFLGQIMQELERNDDLKACYPDVLYWNPAVESPRWSQKSGIILKREGNPKEGTIEAWELSDNLGIGDGTRKRYVGTRYLIGDTYETIINRKAAKVRLHPATHNGRIDGEPVFMSKATLDQKKIDQRSTFAAQMLQNPAAGKQAMFEAEWFRPYEIRPVTLNVYIMADPSMGRTRKSDRTAIAVIGVDAQGNKYLLDGARHRMKLSQRWEMLKRLHHKWKDANGVQILRVGYERYGQQSDMEYFEEQMRNSKEQADTFGIDELAWPNEGDNSKVARVGRLQPDLERSKFYLPNVIKHPDHGVCYWKYDEQDFKIAFEPWRAFTNLQRAMQAQGMSYRIPKAITRYDEDGNIYDVTLALMEELTIFPFGAHDDLADAASRIYDMQPVPATQLDKIDPNLRVHHFDA